jgi:hypothetical protein
LCLWIITEANLFSVFLSTTHRYLEISFLMNSSAFLFYDEFSDIFCCYPNRRSTLREENHEERIKYSQSHNLISIHFLDHYLQSNQITKT